MVGHQEKMGSCFHGKDGMGVAKEQMSGLTET